MKGLRSRLRPVIVCMAAAAVLAPLAGDRVGIHGGRATRPRRSPSPRKPGAR